MDTILPTCILPEHDFEASTVDDIPTADPPAEPATASVSDTECAPDDVPNAPDDACDEIETVPADSVEVTVKGQADTQLKVSELRKLLKREDLPRNGTKQDMINRLVDAGVDVHAAVSLEV